MNMRCNTSSIINGKFPEEMEALMAVDPVCGIQVDERVELADQFTAQYGSQTFYFCSEDCKEVFEESPQQYARKSA